MRKLNEYGLTHAQETFLQEYLKNGGIGYRAYLVAYPNSKNWKRASVDRKASDLLSNAKIQTRINEHNQKINSTLEKSTILNKRKILTEIIDLTERLKASGIGQSNTQLQALKLLSQIAGLLQENKTEININNSVNVAEVSSFLDL